MNDSMKSFQFLVDLLCKGVAGRVSAGFPKMGFDAQDSQDES